MPRLLRYIALLLVLAIGPASVHGNGLVADLSKHLVAITTGFSGADVLLFGTTEEEGDIAVVVRGPGEDIVVRRKQRVAGIWINGRSLTFGHVPAFYAVAATGDVEGFAPPSVLHRHQIGAQYLRFINPKRAEDDEIQEFREALLRNKAAQGLYPHHVGEVQLLGGRLFRTPVVFPANVPTGTYVVEVFVLKDGNVIAAQTTPLLVSKVGTEAEIFDFAHDQSALYGIVAIIIALVAGWLAGAIFRKA
ncbi:MAG: hypothetical protein GY791_18730 [Alphaproteobacteria bacterium]|nr:hypothetical protein [Alphaproteobacteria bacterium]